MKGRKGTGRPQMPPMLALAVAILAVAAIVTAPLAVSKYVITGTGTGTARVAKWDVSIPVGAATTSIRKNNAYVFYAASNIGSGVTTSKTASIVHTFIVNNDSEVTADIKLQAFYIVVDGTDHITGGQPNDASSATGYTIALNTTNTGTVTAQSGAGTGVATYRFSPGAQATFNLTIARHSTTATTRAVRVAATATQVD